MRERYDNVLFKCEVHSLEKLSNLFTAEYLNPSSDYSIIKL